MNILTLGGGLATGPQQHKNNNKTQPNGFIYIKIL